MRILEITNYTKGACGVGKRVMREAELLSKAGHDVRIFSSNFVKGSKDTCKSFDLINNIQINRFPGFKLGGESFIFWNFEKEAKNFNPDIIIAHSYRHIHTLKALKIAKKLKIPCILVTHAPFEREKTRKWFENLSVWFYDRFIGRRTIKKFDNVLMIAPWELEHLLNLGLSKNKILYSPNGVREEFFKSKKNRKKNSLVYTGRIAPIKNLEILINSMKLIDRNTNLIIRGPAEKEYLKEISALVKNNGLESRVKIIDKEYDIKDQIILLNNSEIFILPSKSEGMPQSLIEAMAMGKIVVGSNIKSINSIIQDGKNGFLFKENDALDLSKKINLILSLDSQKRIKIEKNAIDSVKRFKWSDIIKRLDKLIKSELK